MAGIFVATGSNNDIAVSIDGLDWTLASTDFTVSTIIRYITHGKGLIVIGGGSGLLAVSSNGLDWTQIDLSGIGITDAFSSLAFGDGVFLARSGSIDIRSSDGINWSTYTPSTSLGTLSYCKDAFFSGSSGGTIRRSTDGGYTWENVVKENPSSGIWSKALTNIFYSNGMYYANSSTTNVRYTDNWFAYSSDGITWTPANSNPTWGATNSLTKSPTGYGGSLYIIAQASFNAVLMRTTDPTLTQASWAYSSNISGVVWESMVGGDDKLVLVARSKGAGTGLSHMGRYDLSGGGFSWNYAPSTADINRVWYKVEFVPLPSGEVGVWSGSTYIDKPAKVWNGSSWEQKPAKYWDGTDWV